MYRSESVGMRFSHNAMRSSRRFFTKDRLEEDVQIARRIISFDKVMRKNESNFYLDRGWTVWFWVTRSRFGWSFDFSEGVGERLFRG